MAILFVGVIILFFPKPLFFSTVGLFMIGFGNGPLFPNYSYLAPENFGVEVSQSVIGIQMSFAYGGIMLGPLFCGLLGQMIGMIVFPIYLTLLFSIMLIISLSVRKDLLVCREI